MKNSGSSTRTNTNRQNRDSRGRGRRPGREHSYVEGTAVRKPQNASAGGNRAKAAARPGAMRRHKVKAVPMNMGYIWVMAAALVAACFVLMNYVRLQSSITNRVSNISRLESQLNEKRLANDETYTKIMSGIDLEEIRRIAVNELGMRYAKEGQVIEYTGEGNDYVRQYSDIPK